MDNVISMVDLCVQGNGKRRDYVLLDSLSKALGNTKSSSSRSPIHPPTEKSTTQDSLTLLSSSNRRRLPIQPKLPDRAPLDRIMHFSL